MAHKPGKLHYNDKFTQETYDSIALHDINTKNETIKYLEKDLIFLYEIMADLSSYVYRNHKVQVSGSLTISPLAMKIYISKF